MKSVAQRHAEHRRLVRIGVGASAAVHVALFAWITLPVVPLEDDGREERERPSTDALELISIRVPSPAPSAVSATASLEQGAGASGAPPAEGARPTATLAAPTSAAPMVAPAAVERLDVTAALTMAEGIRIGELGEISAVEPAPLAAHGGHDHDHGPGFWERIFGAADITIQHGGICPIDGQPLWGAGGGPPPGFAIPSPRDGGLGAPGGATIGLPGGAKVGLPGSRRPGGFGRPGSGSRGPFIIRR